MTSIPQEIRTRIDKMGLQQIKKLLPQQSKQLPIRRDNQQNIHPTGA
jgi:hypothetical protein